MLFADQSIAMLEPDATFTVLIQPLGRSFDAPDSLTVLEAAGFAGLRLPRSCRNGTCRTCMCKMTSGGVRYQIEWPGVSAEEKAEGYILPCVAIAESDLVLEVSGVQEI
ncbi:2Fe-2S iron-sulfur cluster-binding protein [Paraburkholderia rhizosphaerae]|nr:2Fe-2S iron-sulfur cluster-binding protein [Paraburkholderia rhizosphaerae]